VVGEEFEGVDLGSETRKGKGGKGRREGQLDASSLFDRIRERDEREEIKTGNEIR